MRRRSAHATVLLVLASASVVPVTSCGSPPADRVPGPQLLDENGTTVAAEVTLSDRDISPKRVEIDEGDAVRFVVSGPQSHRLVGEGEGTARYDTGELVRGDATVIRFDRPGEVVLHELDDPSSTVTVHVQALPA